MEEHIKQEWKEFLKILQSKAIQKGVVTEIINPDECDIDKNIIDADIKGALNIMKNNKKEKT